MTHDLVKKILSVFLMVGFLFLLSCTSSESVDDAITDEITADSEGSSQSGSVDEAESEFDEFGEEEIAASEQKAQESVAVDDGPTDELSLEEEQTTAQTPPADDNLEPLNEDPVVESPVATNPEPTAVVSAEPVQASNRVTAINYLSSSNGGSIEIKTTNPAQYKVRQNSSTNQFIIEIEDAILNESLKRPFIMKDFEGAFATINAYQNPGGTVARVVVQMKSGGEPILSQVDSTLLLLPPGGSGTAPVVAAQEGVNAESTVDKTSESSDSLSYNTKDASDNEKILGARTLDEFLTGGGRFFGRPISIQTNDADIRDVLSFIADESGVNLVIADDVDGKVSVKLREVPWDQALVIVMRSRSLGYIRQGNVLRITKLSTLQSEASAAKEIVDSQKKLTPLKVKVLPVSYAAVEDLEKQVTPFLSEGRGKVVSDKRTSSVIITDTADVLLRIERLVKELDIPPAQVMIEGKIVEASESFTRRVGVNWSLSGSPVVIAGGAGRNGNDVRLTPTVGFNAVNQSAAQAQNAFGSLRIGALDFFGNLDATLSLAQADSLVRIISSPRVVTMNKEKAEISQKGQVISIQTIQPAGGGDPITTPTRIDVELKLVVTPQITNEGSVVLEVDLLRQFAGAAVDVNGVERPINSRAAKTKVLVPNGQTAVIGGIYQSDENIGEIGTPGLKDIPVLGWLFKQKSTERIKNELLLFLTPRILNAKDQGVN